MEEYVFCNNIANGITNTRDTGGICPFPEIRSGEGERAL